MAYQKSVSLHFFKNRKPPLCFQWVADRGPQKRAKMRYAYDLKDRFSRLRAAGFMTMEEMASRLDVLPCTVKKWRDKGLLRALRYNDKGECLYESPDVLLPRKGAHKRSYLAAREVVMHNPDEVQCEA